MEINSYMTANLASLQQTVQLSIINMQKNMTTKQATEMLDSMNEVQAKIKPPSEHTLDILV